MVLALLAISSLILFGASSLIVRLTGLPPSWAPVATAMLFLLGLVAGVLVFRDRESTESSVSVE